jgi:transcriptional regulator of acetoin/glycerol metabolism
VSWRRHPGCDNLPLKAYNGAVRSSLARRAIESEENCVRSQDPRDSRDSPEPPLPEAESEHSEVLTAIERSRWNMTHAAAALGISRNTLYRRIKQLGIPLPHARRS